MSGVVICYYMLRGRLPRHSFLRAVTRRERESCVWVGRKRTGRGTCIPMPPGLHMRPTAAKAKAAPTPWRVYVPPRGLYASPVLVIRRIGTWERCARAFATDRAGHSLRLGLALCKDGGGTGTNGLYMHVQDHQQLSVLITCRPFSIKPNPLTKFMYTCVRLPFFFCNEEMFLFFCVGKQTKLLQCHCFRFSSPLLLVNSMELFYSLWI